MTGRFHCCNLCSSGFNYFMVTSSSSSCSGLMSQPSSVRAQDPCQQIWQPSVYERAFSWTHQTHTWSFPHTLSGLNLIRLPSFLRSDPETSIMTRVRAEGLQVGPQSTSGPRWNSLYATSAAGLLITRRRQKSH